MKILLTAGLGSPFPRLAEDLKKLGYKVVLADSAADKEFTSWKKDSPTVMYKPRLLGKGYYVDIQKILDIENPDYYVPMLDEEIIWAHSLKGVKILSPTKHFCAACLNKEDLMQYLRDLKISVVKTWVGDGPNKYPIKYPCFIKPIVGRGSRGARRLENKNEYLAHLVMEGKQPWQMMRQEYLDGDEYTVSVVVNKKNQLMALVPKLVYEKRGITIHAVTEKNGGIYGVCKDVVRKMNPCGTFNVQLKVVDGIPKIFEINPRLSTTSILTTAAGVNEIDLMIKHWEDDSPPYVDFKEGVHMRRRWESVIYE